MLRLIFTALFCYLLVTSIIHGQVSEQFTDGEIGLNPVWYGDTAAFQVNPEGLLELNAAGPGTSLLYTANALTDSTEWLFRIALGFSPSSNNNAKVWLMADSCGVDGLSHGYFLQFGESGSDDAIALVKDSAGFQHELCRGPDGQISSSFDLFVRATRSRSGLWSLYARGYDEVNYVMLDSIHDRSYESTSCFGLECQYTSSNTQAFRFDDIFIREIFVDFVPPAIDTAIAESRRELIIRASEPLLEEQALDPLNYLLEPEGCEADSVSWLDDSHSALLVSFSKDFQNGSHTLFVAQWCDPDTNCSMNLNTGFSTFYPLPWDIVINEIMADPDPPPYGLPPVEYIELLNRSAEDCILEGWTLSINGNRKYLPTIQIEAGKYAVISSDYEACQDFDNCYTLHSLSLTNESGQLILADEQHRCISGLDYSRDWYKDDFKADGGFALEQIDSGRPWDYRGNWCGSTDPGGGTPGSTNKLTAPNPDVQPPLIERIYPLDSFRIMVRLSEPLEKDGLLDPMNYEIAGMKSGDISTRTGDVFASSVVLLLSQPLLNHRIYELTVSGNLTDLSGNPLETVTLPLGIPARPEREEILINEILFDAWPEGSEFVEVYNSSDEAFDMQWLRLCSLDPETKEVQTVCRIIRDTFLICPGELKVFTLDPENIVETYSHSSEKAFIPDIIDFPALPDNQGGVAIYAHEGVLIDDVIYDKTMHSPFLSSPEGVSLERISTEISSSQKSNWTSASWACGYATPGQENSQAVKETEEQKTFFVHPQMISPDGDGTDDILSIEITANEPGSLLNLRIFSESGLLKNTLIMGKTLSDKNMLSWDGTDENGQLLTYGRYIILAEIFEADSDVLIHKEVVWVIP